MSIFWLILTILGIHLVVSFVLYKYTELKKIADMCFKEKDLEGD